ncbi:MAG: metallophosphoesterase family protein [Lachnospiraceae bacterium]|nr:metallophosphoesterase family protein [Lachnospiraceae bacterium]
MRYYIADLHFFHGNMNSRMDKRGFGSVEEMNEYMIQKWNSRIRQNDDIVVLGDFSLGKGEETNGILRRLNGRKFLIEGNHDRFLNDRKFDKKLFHWIKPYEEMKDNKRKVVLSHYPIFCYNGQYRLNKEGDAKTYMLFGHVHNTFDDRLVGKFINITKNTDVMLPSEDRTRVIPCQMINCFCMFSDYTPLTLDEWIELDAKRRIDQKDVSPVGFYEEEG